MDTARESYIAGNFPKAIEEFTKAIYGEGELDTSTKAKAFANRSFFVCVSFLTF